jgi:RNase P/RNase MRP subunit POP5
MVRVKQCDFIFQFHFYSNPLNVVKSTLETMITRLYGDLGTTRVTRNLLIIYNNRSTHVAISRCLRDDRHTLRNIYLSTNE